MGRRRGMGCRFGKGGKGGGFVGGRFDCTHFARGT